MQANENHDVLIIGAGPAGCSAATLLAEQGHRVLVLEREKFPRYHVGESLIPFTYPALERLGLVDRMKQSHFVKKYSVQFVQPNGRASQPFYFFNRYDRETIAQSWQILRSEFDQMLLDYARGKGAEVREETTVTGLLKDGERVTGVRVKDQSGRETELHAPITLDCTGKESFAALRQGWRMKDPYLNKVAVWTYYQGSKRESGIDEGQTTVAMLPDKGWFWHIPQHDDMVSVGVVAEGKYLSRDGVKDPQAIFDREVG
jgi:flavin-dependent dehydrogenase